MNISKTHTRAAILAAATSSFAALEALPTNAADYYLPAGETDSFSGASVTNYDSITVEGDLSISGNAQVMSTNVTITGGTVSISGQYSALGWRTGNASSATIAPNAGGQYGKVTVSGGSADGFNVSGITTEWDCYNFGGKTLTIAAENEAARQRYADGVFDFLDLSGGANFYSVENNSSLTGRVSVAGSSKFGKADGWCYGEGFFKKGNFLVELASGATLRFMTGNHQGSLNQANCNVRMTGAGDVVFLQSYNSYRCSLRKGTVLDTTGTITFNSGSATVSGWYYFEDGDVFGPSAGRISTAIVSGGKDGGVILEVAPGVAVTVHDLDAKRDADALAGAGAVRIDATAAARTFEANIPATFGNNNAANTLTVAKFGAYEAIVAATNIPTLAVESGTVRLTNNCVIGTLSGADGATLIADGCTVALGDGGCFAKGLAFETANGGSFVKTGSGNAIIYGPGSLDGTLHVADGDLAFSTYGLPQKFWRWTFMKVATSPNPLWLGRLWLFDVDGGHAAKNLSVMAGNTAASALNAGSVCWAWDSSTNLTVAAGTADWQAAWNIQKAFNDNFSSLNNFAKLATPVVDPGNSVSWPAVVFRRKADDKDVTGYNMMAEDSARYPVSWKVEASDDGVAWTEIETRTNVTHAHPGASYFYDGEYCTAAQTRGKPIEHFKFSGYRRNGLAADSSKAVTLQVAEDASVDLTAFTASAQKINGLTVDFAEGGGTILGGTLATSGTLTIVNALQGFAPGSPLPLTLSGVADAANISNWTVTVDGAAKKFLVKIDGNGHPVLDPPSTVMIFR